MMSPLMPYGAQLMGPHALASPSPSLPGGVMMPQLMPFGAQLMSLQGSQLARYSVPAAHPAGAVPVSGTEVAPRKSSQAALTPPLPPGGRSSGTVAHDSIERGALRSAATAMTEVTDAAAAVAKASADVTKNAAGVNKEAMTVARTAADIALKGVRVGVAGINQHAAISGKVDKGNIPSMAELDGTAQPDEAPPPPPPWHQVLLDAGVSAAAVDSLKRLLPNDADAQAIFQSEDTADFDGLIANLPLGDRLKVNSARSKVAAECWPKK